MMNQIIDQSTGMRRFRENQGSRIKKLTLKYSSIDQKRPSGAISGEELKLNNY